MRFRGFLLVAVTAAFSLYGFSLSFAYDINPLEPVQGDIITLTGSCTPGSNVPITLEFSRDAAVSGGRYEYDIGTIQLPTSSTLSIRAENVVNLKLGWKVLIWFTLTVDGANGVATYSRSMPSGKYRLKVFGDALGQATTVKLDFKAATNIQCDGGGNLLYTYDSRYLPIGVYKIDVNGEVRTIELLGERPGPAQTPTPTETPTPTPPPGRQVSLVANEIDYSLSADLIGRLGLYDLAVVRASAPKSCTLILGGPDAYDGVGEVVRGYLDLGGQSSVRTRGSKEFFKRGDVMIVAGSDRYMTREAFEERFMEVVANLVSCLDAY